MVPSISDTSVEMSVTPGGCFIGHPVYLCTKWPLLAPPPPVIYWMSSVIKPDCYGFGVLGNIRVHLYDGMKQKHLQKTHTHTRMDNTNTK